MEIIESSSQTLSQITAFSQGSQGGDEEKFMENAQVLNLAQISALQKDTTCVTIAITRRIEPSPNGWNYERCTVCPKKVIKKNDNYACNDGHVSQAPIKRYKVQITVVDKKDKSKFMFWDNECTKIMGISANDLVKKMFDEGENDEKGYPLDLDYLCRKTAAFRFNVQPRWKQASVSWIWNEPEMIKKIRDQLEPQEQTSNLKLDKSIGENTAAIDAKEALVSFKKVVHLIYCLIFLIAPFYFLLLYK